MLAHSVTWYRKDKGKTQEIYKYIVLWCSEILLIVDIFEEVCLVQMLKPTEGDILRSGGSLFQSTAAE